MLIFFNSYNYFYAKKSQFKLETDYYNKINALPWLPVTSIFQNISRIKEKCTINLSTIYGLNYKHILIII
jgi:hypothetical protein